MPLEKSEESLQRVTAVMITFNSRVVLADALASLPNLGGVVVVDNASLDDSADIAQIHPTKPKVIRGTENRGYGSAANRGFAEVKTEFALLLNVDVVLRGACVEELIKAADRYPDGGLFGCNSWEPDGTLQFGRTPYLSTFLPARGWSPIVPEGDCCAAYAGGAAMFYRMEAFRDIGGFDEELFLFAEDDDMCLRLTDQNWSLIHVAAAHADHKAGQSTTGVSKLYYWKQWHMAWSALHLESKRKGKAAAKMTAEKALPRLRRKALLYRLLFNKKKTDRFSARLAATKAYLAGKRAQDVRLGN